MSTIINVILALFVAYMIINIMFLSKRNNKNRRLLTLFDNFDNESVFFKVCDEYLNSIKDQEFITKGQILKICGMSYYHRFDEIEKTINELDLMSLCNTKSKRNNGLDLNEDSFYYLYVAIPNSLYANGRVDLIEVLHNKLQEIDEICSTRFIKNIGDNCYRYYTKTDDLGKSFFEKVRNLEYDGYAYSKQLIALFKNVCLAMLARIYLDENNDKYNELKDDVKEFYKTKASKRLLDELKMDIEE